MLAMYLFGSALFNLPLCIDIDIQILLLCRNVHSLQGVDACGAIHESSSGEMVGGFLSVCRAKGKRTGQLRIRARKVHCA